MQNLEKRLAALESQLAGVVRWVWRNAGETDEMALARLGASANESIIIFSWRE